MTFDLEFPYKDDTVYLAYSRPYPYSKILAAMFDQEEHLRALPQTSQSFVVEEDKEKLRLKIARKGILYERSLLCKTICGLPMPVIQITNSSNGPVENKKRKVIFITARVHPGETSASTVYEGFMQGLLQGDPVETSLLMGHFVFRTIPCLNPDGVVCGNYRSSLAGVDLNRQWICPNKELHPEVYHTKALMRQVTQKDNRQILIYCDIHCHSKKKNSFLYGCNTAGDGAPFSTWTQVRLLLFLWTLILFHFGQQRGAFAWRAISGSPSVLDHRFDALDALVFVVLGDEVVMLLLAALFLLLSRDYCGCRSTRDLL